MKEPKNAFMITDFQEKGDLLKNVNTKGRFTEEEARVYFTQILSAIKYLHSKDIVHRDIKLQNVLLLDDKQVQLIDFGFACSLDSDEITSSSEKTVLSNMNDIKGTKGYISPEVLEAQVKICNCLDDTSSSSSKQPGIVVNLKKSDIFSLGVMLFEMVVGVPPFINADPRDSCYRFLYFKKRVERFWNIHPKTKELDKKEGLSDSFKSLIQGILTPFPVDRLSIEEIEEHPWMNL